MKTCWRLFRRKEQIFTKISRIYGDGTNITPRDVGVDLDSGYGESDYIPIVFHKILIAPEFVNDPTGMYSVDKLIDTLTHEMRHQYQEYQEWKFSTDLPTDLISPWSFWNYISSSDDYDEYYRQPVEADAKAFAALSQDDD